MQLIFDLMLRQRERFVQNDIFPDYRLTRRLSLDATWYNNLLALK
ncbi:MAG: hypothetical protein SAJ37_09370 [Oscillatoria sp. PMC 1068.18]|nr:hypothetical protein [Oscillatoria sp. PMC 1076.18]MEC4988945.1 hypothetical protein [Oscillatoria sp. PMC 1068.18]